MFDYMQTNPEPRRVHPGLQRRLPLRLQLGLQHRRGRQLRQLLLAGAHPRRQGTSAIIQSCRCRNDSVMIHDEDLALALMSCTLLPIQPNSGRTRRSSTSTTLCTQNQIKRKSPTPRSRRRGGGTGGARLARSRNPTKPAKPTRQRNSRRTSR